MTLPPGYSVRPATMDDLQIVTALTGAYDISQYGESDADEVLLKAEWEAPTFDIARDTWLVTAPDGTATGFMLVQHDVDDREVFFDGYVHPDHTGLGIGGEMIRLATERAHEIAAAKWPGQPWRLRTGMTVRDKRAVALLEENGMAPVRYFWHMGIKFDAPPDAPQFPPGVGVENLRPGVDERVFYEALEETFADHWGHTVQPYEEFLRNSVERADFDPSLWFIARHGDEIVGILASTFRSGVPWIRALGVRRPWRRQKIALALLRHSFQTFYERGERQVRLGVDAASPTGATHLYTGAGMSPVREYAIYEKPMGNQTAPEAKTDDQLAN